MVGSAHPTESRRAFRFAPSEELDHLLKHSLVLRRQFDGGVRAVWPARDLEDDG